MSGHWTDDRTRRDPRPAPLSLAADCCAPLLGEPLTSALARTLKALADPTRLRPVSMAAAHEGAAGPRQVTKVSGSWPRPP